MKHSLILIAGWPVPRRWPACGEKPQTAQQRRQGGRGRVPGHRAWPFAAPGWKPGDKTSWEQQLKTRTQNGQNEYTKVN